MRKIRAAVDIPVVAIGGINHANAEEVLAATGAEGLAVVSCIFDHEDVAGKSREMREIIDRSKMDAA